MHSLIITAHPSSKGFTHQVANAYKEEFKACGGTITILDLYAPENFQDFLKFEEISDISDGTPKAPDAIGQKMRDAIMRADEIVFVFPIWWFSAPAILKNFLDHNLGAKFAFEFVDGKPKGLLPGKTARIFATADGPKALYTFLRFLFTVPFTKFILGFCGIKTTSVDIFADRAKWKNTSREAEILAHVRSRVSL